jgi:hypothetical protein
MKPGKVKMNGEKFPRYECPKSVLICIEYCAMENKGRGKFNL